MSNIPIILEPKLLNQIENHVEGCLPEEACGILAGIDGTVKKVLPITNQIHSPVRFYMDPVELLHALEWIEQQKYELVGIFHSHPNGPEFPSPTDIREFNYPGAAVIIMSKNERNWKIRAFMIEENKFEEIELILNENS